MCKSTYRKLYMYIHVCLCEGIYVFQQAHVGLRLHLDICINEFVNASVWSYVYVHVHMNIYDCV